MRNTLSARLTYRIMAVVLVMMAVIAGVVYFTVKESMLFESQARYLNVLRKIQGEQRRITTMVDMPTVNNAHDIERMSRDRYCFKYQTIGTERKQF